MKTSFDWTKLHQNKCPNMLCNNGILELNKNTDQWFCDSCDFVIIDWKLKDIQKGSKSIHYKKNALKFKAKRHSIIIRKERLEYALQLQEKEREYNRRRIQQSK